MQHPPYHFSDLAARDPALRDLERRVQATSDPGTGSFFCSNHAWLPVASALRGLVGVGRPGWSRRTVGDPLYDSRAFEACYEYLSHQLPPCRGCGCRGFQPWRDRQVAARRC